MLMSKEIKYGSTEHLLQSSFFQIVFIICLVGFSCIIYFFYLNPKESKKMNSASKFECGYFVKHYSSPDSDNLRNGRMVDYFLIRTDQGEEKSFIKNANFAKFNTKLYKETEKMLKMVKANDKICLTYSVIYYEDFGKKVRDMKIPYLITINSIGE